MCENATRCVKIHVLTDVAFFVCFLSTRGQKMSNIFQKVIKIYARCGSFVQVVSYQIRCLVLVCFENSSTDVSGF